jgi:DHA2 family multidrug resistance protein-like MFS transporter
LTGAISAAEQLPESLRAGLLHGAREAFAGGMHVVVAVSGALMIGIAMLAATRLRHVQPIGRKAAAGE